MHREIAPDPMPSAVIEVEPCFPQRPPREWIEVLPARALGETGGGEGDRPLEYKPIVPPHLRRRRADSDGAGHVGRAIAILCARIDEIERALLQIGRASCRERV